MTLYLQIVLSNVGMSLTQEFLNHSPELASDLKLCSTESTVVADLTL